jgi:hypothetical protein
MPRKATLLRGLPGRCRTRCTAEAPVGLHPYVTDVRSARILPMFFDLRSLIKLLTSSISWPSDTCAGAVENVALVIEPSPSG